MLVAGAALAPGSVVPLARQVLQAGALLAQVWPALEGAVRARRGRRVSAVLARAVLAQAAQAQAAQARG